MMMRSIVVFLALASASIFFASASQARPHRHHHAHHYTRHHVRHAHHRVVHRRHVRRRTVRRFGDGRYVIGGRPRGCPYEFCGCGASLRVFGRIIPALNLARNWLLFRHTTPQAGMVAVRRHHVFVLERHLSGSVWLAYDANSGGHRVRRHPRSIAGFVIVDPHSAYAGRAVMAAN